ncbi:MAG: potassium transporter [Verrucomicrobia bacterium Tous-C9LFEB]|nr:MAG: potassium transporter [Verrucomicrobia bacterium Tous-C9LFEB]
MSNTTRPNPWHLMVGALGIVFGDIGTSPLYAMRECLSTTSDVDPGLAVMGSLSLVFWALMWVVSFKYITFVMRADNHGEGGIFALLALIEQKRRSHSKRIGVTVFVILAGAALLYGDGIITPAISVLSASEGLEVLNPSFAPLVVPITCLILAVLFFFQKHGTATIGRIFGPVMLVWFTVLGILGLMEIVKNPTVLHALNPYFGWDLLRHDPRHATALLGSVVLAITGAEALYADMGHFGRTAIVRGWYCVVLPGLVLNYFGQGAWALANPASKVNPFFALAPAGPLQFGLVILSFLATVIASQALISGTFSLSRQAIQLGFFPRMSVTHTSDQLEGQIYVGFMNWAMAAGSIGLVLGFKSSENLAAAYGIAVTGTMSVTTFAFYLVARRSWGWSLAKALPLCMGFLVVDLAFFGSNWHKILDGGWLPLVVGAVLLAVMHTWKSGRNHISDEVYARTLEPELVIEDIRQNKIYRNPGTAIFMAGRPIGMPIVLLHHLKCNRCIHETVVLLSMVTDPDPSVPDDKALELIELGEGFWRAIVHYGYMQQPNVGKLIPILVARGVPIKERSLTYFFNREIIIPGGRAPMPHWQKSLYGVLSRNARPARDYYNIPANQIVEMGLAVHI